MNNMAQKTLKALFELVEPPVRSKLSDSIISQIEKLILEGALKPGNKLPPEREFAELLGVSRPHSGRRSSSSKRVGW